MEERETRYRTALSSIRQQLTTLHGQHQQALNTNDPAPEECWARVSRQPAMDRRLWERSPKDGDFLTLRLGLGERPSPVTLKVPRPADPTAIDPLLEEAQKLAREFAALSDVPICLPLGEVIVAGLAGDREEVLNLVRSLVVQLATHHSPDEVKIVAIFPAHEANRWDWMRWLPHVWTDDRSFRFLACERDAAHRLLMGLFDQLGRRQAQFTATREGTALRPIPQFVFLFADSRLVENEPILPLLLAGNSVLGACAIFLADRSEHLPKECQAVVEMTGSEGRLLQTAPKAGRFVFKADETPLDLADRLARRLAPIRLQRLSAVTEIPRIVPLLDLFGVAAVEELDVAKRWQQSRTDRSLAVPIGRRAAGQLLTLDLHDGGQGPHGLVAGTTGSGKSELLQSLVASLAVHFHPHQVVFVLVDYKGGGMAGAFQGLPHLVGTITNLQGGMAWRALAALKSELHRREHLLARAGATNIHEYQKRLQLGQAKEPLPHLVIIVDEFAELKTELPEFIGELVRTARVGRSLGVHLILATQKPAGVVSEEIWANSSFRICLRVERPEDSQEVLKRPDAAGLSKDTPGRAYLQVGTSPLMEFQAAWGGAPYGRDGKAAVNPEAIVEVTLDGSRRPLHRMLRSASSHVAGTQLQALVAFLKGVAQRQGIQSLPGPWLPPLPEHLPLDQVRPGEGFDGRRWRAATTWLEPAVGLLDDPARQVQGPLRLPLGKEGHLAVYGAPGTGKTTFLQTLAVSLALTHSPRDVHLYLLDFGSRALTVLAGLPHVGGVILADEQERLTRLLRFLVREMEERKARFAQAGVTTLRDYRKSTADPPPAIVVMLDNYAGFNDLYRDTPVEENLVQVTREGGNLGIHVVLTAINPSSVKTKIANNITAAVTF
ncbi:MAG: type VII secretion protein EssC, partial [Caldilineales bacterium]|nr:type VII secretion protein EssC [Caldilineales bacterium]